MILYILSKYFFNITIEIKILILCYELFLITHKYEEYFYNILLNIKYVYIYTFYFHILY